VGFQHHRATRSCRRDHGRRHVPLASGPARRFAGDGAPSRSSSAPKPW
jgi:hypothetical protein